MASAEANKEAGWSGNSTVWDLCCQICIKRKKDSLEVFCIFSILLQIVWKCNKERSDDLSENQARLCTHIVQLYMQPLNYTNNKTQVDFLEKFGNFIWWWTWKHCFPCCTNTLAFAALWLDKPAQLNNVAELFTKLVFQKRTESRFCWIVGSVFSRQEFFRL